MKIVIFCSKCHLKIRIPNDKHIRFNCPNPVCDKRHEFKKGKEVKRSFWIPLFALLTLAFGLFSFKTSPIPALLGITWFFWWFLKRSKYVLKKLISTLMLPTAIGLSIVFVIQIVLNFTSSKISTKIPEWLIKLDDLLIWLRYNISYLSEFSFSIYLIIVLSLLIITYKKPKWELVSKFLTLNSWLGRVVFILVITTSFTFFSPAAFEKQADKIFYKYYQVAYRENLKQDRKKLIAKAIIKQIEEKDTKLYFENIPNFTQVIQTIPPSSLSSKDEAEKDVKDIMRSLNILKSKTSNASIQVNSTSDDKIINDSWEKESKKWKTSKESFVKHNRRTYTETKINTIKNATKTANETLETLKAIFIKFCGQISPEVESAIGAYIEETINTSAEYVFNKFQIDRIINQFFSSYENGGRLNLFSRMRSWWLQTDDKLAEEKRKILIRKEQVASENAKLLRRKEKNHLNKIRRSNKWGIIRINFYNSLINNEFPLLNEENRSLNVNAYDRWLEYLNNNQSKFYSNSIQDIEPYFFTFIKNDPELLITWAYTLLANESKLKKLSPADALNYYFRENGESYEKFSPSEEFLIRMLNANDKLCGKNG